MPKEAGKCRDVRSMSRVAGFHAERKRTSPRRTRSRGDTESGSRPEVATENDRRPKADEMTLSKFRRREASMGPSIAGAERSSQ